VILERVPDNNLGQRANEDKNSQIPMDESIANIS
jgi:hypothetical protein